MFNRIEWVQCLLRNVFRVLTAVIVSLQLLKQFWFKWQVVRSADSASPRHFTRTEADATALAKEGVHIFCFSGKGIFSRDAPDVATGLKQ